MTVKQVSCHQAIMQLKVSPTEPQVREIKAFSIAV